MIFGWSAIVVYGCYNIQSNFFMRIISCASTSEKKMSLTFDDGPSQFSHEILGILKEQNVKTVFFLIGEKIKGNEELVKVIRNNGHIIGNHSYSHSYFFDFFSSSKMLHDLKKFDDLVYKVDNIRPRLFRPPFGVLNPNLANVIKRGNYIPIGWSIRSMDTLINDSDRLQEKLKSSFHPGAVILLHDTSKITRDTLTKIIQDGRSQGYEWVRLDQLLNITPYA